MGWGEPDPMFAGWEELGWQERRKRRFERWLSARGVEFADDATEEDYRQRIQLLMDAIALGKPERVPVSANVQFYSGKHSGLTKREAMYDHKDAP